MIFVKRANCPEYEDMSAIAHEDLNCLPSILDGPVTAQILFIRMKIFCKAGFGDSGTWRIREMHIRACLRTAALAVESVIRSLKSQLYARHGWTVLSSPMNSSAFVRWYPHSNAIPRAARTAHAQEGFWLNRVS